MSKSKEKVIILGLILLMIVAVVGVSYAAFSYTGTGTQVNSITSGAIMMTYTESDNVINMTGALPTTDATGTVRLTEGEYFDFTISSNITGNVNINYEISAKDVTVSDRKIDGSNIKLYLTRITEDGTEEELMTPETYNEETNANNYTGRPAGEMSLYASSMNSSETNNYRLRMYVTEEYNPQGDGGGLEFSVKINVYGKDGDKMPVPAVETLLAKTNPEGLDYNSATAEQQKEMWTFSHPATEQTGALTDYRYIGANPNNYITFNNETWRIIGVFTVDDGTGKMEERLKIIRDESIGTITWDTNSVNNWPTATLNTNLNSGDYWTNSLGSEAKEMIGDTLWYLGGAANYESVSTGLTSHFYSYERGTDVYSGRDTFWVGKVGLMYPSDYGYATSGGPTTDRNTCLNKELSSWNNSSFSDCKNNDWLFTYAYQWTITPMSSYNGSVFFLNFTGSVNGNPVDSDNMVQALPVVFLKSNVKIAAGDGSSSNPYILEI